MPQTETFEYGYVHGLLIDALTKDEAGNWIDGQWVAIVETAPALSVEGDNKPLLAIFNELGQSGWVIGDAHRAKVENNTLPDSWLDALESRFGHWGLIRSRESRWMYRRLGWNDTEVV